MKFITVTLALVVLGRAASVTPLKGSTIEAVFLDDVSNLSASITVDSPPNVESDEPTVKTPSLKGLSTTSANSAFHALTPNINQAFYACTGQGCTGTCYTYDLSSLVPNTCYGTAAYFQSAAVYSYGGFALPYGVYVGQAKCLAPVQLPVVNNCYNLFYNGASVYDSTVFIVT